MARIVVFHSGFGCETGCCGHTIAFLPDDAPEKFEDKWDVWAHMDDERFCFDHPWGSKEGWQQWAEDLIRVEFGEEHVKDLDWENSWVIDD